MCLCQAPTTFAEHNCGCGQQSSCRTVEHVHRHVYCHRHCHHCRDCCPPTGVVVPSVPGAMPLMAMPAAPVAMMASPAAYTLTAPSAMQQSPSCGSEQALQALQKMEAMMER